MERDKELNLDGIFEMLETQSKSEEASGLWTISQRSGIEGLGGMRMCKMGIFKFINELVTQDCCWSDQHPITYHSVEVDRIKGMCRGNQVDVSFLTRGGTKIGDMRCDIIHAGKDNFMIVKSKNEDDTVFSVKSFMNIFHKSLKIHQSAMKLMK
jgi:hypothetical protein